VLIDSICTELLCEFQKDYIMQIQPALELALVITKSSSMGCKISTLIKKTDVSLHFYFWFV
jgi:hypothetical protein